jgi:hypothetical protein
MPFHARSGQTSYGERIGILLLDTQTPFVHGDIGNANTYRYPVRYRRVDGLTVGRILAHDRGYEEAVVEAARELEREGVRAIASDCGFLALYQEAVQAAVRIPVLLSSLLQLPLIASLLPPDQGIAVVTADSRSLDETLLGTVGATALRDRLAVGGLETCPGFRAAALEESGPLEVATLRREVVEVATGLCAEKGFAIGAILLECSLLPPYSAEVQQATGRPVFDFLSLIDFVAGAYDRPRFPERLD